MTLAEMIAQVEARTLPAVTIACDSCVTRGTGEDAPMRRKAKFHMDRNPGHTVTETAGQDESVKVSDKVWAKRHGLSL